ncbi:uncharacterized protein LOC122195844 [Lactuca sativa]|uniref:uncharacterized protein LOC122195844 n=1 Tax=Lactuca sativa TaxID=4236 RepID=UPI001C68779B|nr:uncharacterized protein LOC122195844 [Lactuca sativa]
MHRQRRDISTFYIAGFPDGTCKLDLHGVFDAFGQVSDIYIGGKKNRRNQNFAFIRYAGVKDIQDMEKKMNGIRCRGVSLIANLAKYQAENPDTGRTTSGKSKVSVPKPGIKIGSRDSRTYAQAVAGTNAVRSGNSPPIPLNAKTAMCEWIKKTLLIGEAHSLDHIANLPNHTFTHENTRYLGGLKLGIKFGSSKEAREFLEDRPRWHEWFKWLKIDADKEVQYERLAWLRITGVPLRFWDTDNFSLIAGRYGQVIIPFDSIFDRRDLSMGNVGIITSLKNWINEEVKIYVEGETYKVGVVEYTEGWSPFKPGHFDRAEDDLKAEDSEFDSEEDGISDTWIPEYANDLEEGEFRSDDEPGTQLEKSNRQAMGGNAPVIVENSNVASHDTIGAIPQKDVNLEPINESVAIPHVTNRMVYSRWQSSDSW